MALIHADPFAHYTGTQIGRVYTTLDVNGTVATGPYGRAGGPGLRFSGDYSDSVARYTDSRITSPTGIYEFDLRVSAAPPATNVICAFYDGTSVQCSLDLQTDRSLAVYRSFGGGKTLLSAVGYTVPLNTYVHISFKATISNSGSVTVKVWADDTGVPTVTLSLSGVDTQATGNASWNGYDVGAACNGTTDISNLVVMDGAGARLNDILGPVDVTALWANGRLAPSQNEWSLSSGTSVAALIDDSAADDDLTYLYAASAGSDQSVYVDPVPFPDREILGWELYACTKKGGSGSPTVAPLVRQGSTDTVGSATAASASYAYTVLQPYNQMPDGSAFTATAFDALQHGVEQAA